MEKGSKITSVVAHIDHGKTTLIDSLIASQGYISKSLAGELRYLDSRKDEQERGITLKLSPIKLKNGYMFIDTPGHVDFESLVFCSSILSDNHMILIDVNEGITPRTYSLIKFLNRSRTILVLNKIDKCESFDTIECIVHQMNGLFKDTVFEWEKNNIIICSASLCSGVNYNIFKLNSKNSLKIAFKAFKMLNQKYDNNDVQDILKKYNIKYKTRKAVCGAVFPLSDAIFDSVNSLYSGDKNEILNNQNEVVSIRNEIADNRNDLDLQNIVSNPLSKITQKISDLEIDEKATFYRIKNEFYDIQSKEIPEMLGISVYGIFQNKTVYEKDNVLFVTRILKGTVAKGETVFTCTSDGVLKEVKIEGIYEFSIDNFVEIDSAQAPALVCLKGDFSKNSVISSNKVEFKMASFLKSVYKAKLVLSEMSELNRIKSTIKTISYTEQCLKAKLNKYSEIEMCCSGRVQFEKIVHDLQNCGFHFKIAPAKKEFKEYASLTKGLYYRDENVEFIIKIGNVESLKEDKIEEYPIDYKILKVPFDHENSKSKEKFCNNEEFSSLQDSLNFRKIERPGGNIFFIRGSAGIHIVESVLEVFISIGPLIKENIINTFIVVDFINSSDTKIFSILKNELTNLYSNCNPQICPKLYAVKIFITQEFLGGVYFLLEKYDYLMDEEIFDDETDFYQIKCQIPQFLFAEFIEEIQIKTRGTAYLEVNESESYRMGDFSKHIQAIRKEKGMFVDEKIDEIVEKPKLSKK